MVSSNFLFLILPSHFSVSPLGPTRRFILLMLGLHVDQTQVIVCMEKIWPSRVSPEWGYSASHPDDHRRYSQITRLVRTAKPKFYTEQLSIADSSVVTLLKPFSPRTQLLDRNAIWLLFLTSYSYTDSMKNLSNKFSHFFDEKIVEREFVQIGLLNSIVIMIRPTQH